MAELKQLDNAQFHATFAQRMSRVEPDAKAIAEIPVAMKSIRPDQLQGFSVEVILVERVHRGDSGLFEHYLISTTTANVFVVLVWERSVDQSLATMCWISTPNTDCRTAKAKQLITQDASPQTL